MHRCTALILMAALLLSGCASMDGVFGRPAPSRPDYGRYTVPGDTPGRQSNPKTKPYTVMGKRYSPIQNAAGYDQIGVASWYGADFHGKPTASGDIYDMHAMTAAHKTLPLGTIVQVTNLENGRQTNLLVNDRGPFVGERLIDLSYAAARVLGSDQKGLARVRIRAVGTSGSGRAVPAPVQTAQRQTPQRSPQPVASQAPVSRPASEVDVQVGAFRDRSNADKVLAHLRSKGFNGAHVTSVRRDSGTLYLVRVRVSDPPQARRALEQVRVYYPSSFIAS